MQQVILNGIDLRDFLSHMRSIIKEEINKVDLTKPSIEEEIGNIDLAIKVTKLSKPTIYRKCLNRDIPHGKKGKKLIFKRSELIEWLESGKRKTLKELENEASEYFKKKNY